MAQRRKIEISVANKPDDVGLDFQHVAGEVAKLYRQSVKMQPVSYDAGRRHSLMKAHDWISSQIQEGKSVTSTDIITYLQNELNNSLSADLHLNGAASSSSSTSTENREPGANVPQDMEEDLPQV